jgi:hypothetical protein
MLVNNCKQNDSSLEPKIYYGYAVHILDLHKELPSSPDQESRPKETGQNSFKKETPDSPC